MSQETRAAKNSIESDRCEPGAQGTNNAASQWGLRYRGCKPDCSRLCDRRAPHTERDDQNRQGRGEDATCAMPPINAGKTTERGHNDTSISWGKREVKQPPWLRRAQRRILPIAAEMSSTLRVTLARTSEIAPVEGENRRRIGPEGLRCRAHGGYQGCRDTRASSPA